MENEPATMKSGKSGCENVSGSGIKYLDSTPHASANAANQAGSFFLI